MPTRQQLEQQFIQDRAFWGSVGSRWRGLAGGVLLGGAVGMALGVAAAGLFSVVANVAVVEMGKATLLGLIGFFGGSGMLVGANLWGAAGQVSGAVASGLMAQKEFDPAVSKELQKEITIPNEIASQQDAQKKPPLFNPKVIAIAAAIAATIGAIMGATGALPQTAGYIPLGQQTGTAMGAAAAGTTLGLFGVVFGISFRPWQKFKEWTDGFFEGKVNGRSAPSVEQLKSVLLEQSPDKERVNEPVGVEKPRKPYTEALMQERMQDAPALGI